MPAKAVATFAAGCFWGVEAAFARLDGVIATRVGYTGGHTPAPTYEQVCTGTTGHAEAVEVIFDPDRISYEDLLDIFWRLHDPTQLNAQGPDIGTQYRSEIFVHSEAQRRAAQHARERENASGRHARPIVTKISPAGDFFPAEDYHQRYFEKRGLAR